MFCKNNVINNKVGGLFNVLRAFTRVNESSLLTKTHQTLLMHLCLKMGIIIIVTGMKTSLSVQYRCWLILMWLSGIGVSANKD